VYDDSTLPCQALASEFYDKYEPREQLGSGGSSIVRRCISKENNQEYAVKIIDLTGGNGSCNQDQDIVKFVENEISLLKRVNGQRNCIKMIKFFKTQAYYFIIFELMSRGELFDYLTKQITLSESQVRKMMWQIFSAIQGLHAKNVIHRDVKMENLLLDNDLRLKITDFGFAQHLNNKNSKLFDLCGTVSYMSPEMLKSNIDSDNGRIPNGYSLPVDIWACGVIMYTLFMGRAPFYHRKEILVLRKIMNCDYKMAGPEFNVLSDNAKNLIARCLTLNPDDRITAKEALGHDFFVESAEYNSLVLDTCEGEEATKELIQDNLQNLKNSRCSKNTVRSGKSGKWDSISVQSGSVQSGSVHSDSVHSISSNSSRNQEVPSDSIVIDIDSKNNDNLDDSGVNTKNLQTPPKKLTFRALAYAIRAVIRFRNSGQERISKTSLAHLAIHRPYDISSMRHIIDQSAYNIYGHWLQRENADYGSTSVETDQSHAMLFENSYKIQGVRLEELRAQESVRRRRRLSQKKEVEKNKVVNAEVENTDDEEICN